MTIFHRAIGRMCLGFAIGLFGTGVWKADVQRLSLAFVFLGLAWLYREMDLGWNEETKSWRFLCAKRKAHP
jgi:hypothetical protein